MAIPPPVPLATAMWEKSTKSMHLLRPCVCTTTYGEPGSDDKDCVFAYPQFIHDVSHPKGGYENGYSVACNHCGMGHGRPQCSTLEGAIKEWNTMPLVDDLINALSDAKFVLEHVRPLIRAAGVPPLSFKLGPLAGIGTGGAHKITHVLKDIDKALAKAKAGQS